MGEPFRAAQSTMLYKKVITKQRLRWPAYIDSSILRIFILISHFWHAISCHDCSWITFISPNQIVYSQNTLRGRRLSGVLELLYGRDEVVWIYHTDQSGFFLSPACILNLSPVLATKQYEDPTYSLIIPAQDFRFPINKKSPPGNGKRSQCFARTHYRENCLIVTTCKISYAKIQIRRV